MHPEAEKRAAHLAVNRYGAAAAKVQRLYKEVLQANTRGQSLDFLDSLVRQKLLTDVQAQELRAGLDTTHFDTNPQKPVARPAKNGRKLPVIKPTAELNGTDFRQLGSYRILRRLGDGGMGTVYLGYHETDQRHVAIKVLPEHLAGNQGAIDRFYREAKSGALLNHANIVRILAIGQEQASGRHYLVMEYVDGPSAHELMQRTGRLSVGDAVHLILDIARALEHAHSRNVIHRDIKPANILVTQSGLAKLTDLGLAKRTDEASHLTAARQGFGTPYYMPYEQAMNAKYADGRSDIYALGATLYHLVAGEVPFQGESHLEVVEKKNIGDYPPASAYNSAVPAALDGILTRMLARDPADRYQTASELIVDLERSALAAPMPSFIDADRALQDPVVRERMVVQSQPTALDMRLPHRELPPPLPKSDPDIWYLRYRDTAGRWCKAKATTEQVLKRLRERHFPGDVEGSHLHDAEFRPLHVFDVFAKAIADAAKNKTTRRTVAFTESTDETVTEKPLERNKPRRGSMARPNLVLFTSAAAVVIAVAAAVLARVLFWP